MAFSGDWLNDIYDRTSGYCHLCHKKLAFQNYNKRGQRGAWHVEHSNARARGGTDRLNNLYAACIDCNLVKGTLTTKTVRSWKGKSRAPLSGPKRARAKAIDAASGALMGGAVGSFAGPWGAVIGAAVGARLGYRKNPDR